MTGRNRDKTPRAVEVIAWMVVGIVASLSAGAQEAGGPPSLGLSTETALGEREWSALRDTTVRVRLIAEWSRVERARGSYDWSSHDRDIAALARHGARVVLAVRGTNPLYLPDGGRPGPNDQQAFDGWLRFVRSAVKTFAGRVETLEIGDSREIVDDPVTYAFRLKSSVLAARAEATAAGVRMAMAQAPLPDARLDLQRALWREDIAAYLDVLPVELASSDASSGETLRALLDENVRHPPAADVWALVRQSEADPWAAAETALRALAAGLSTALVELPADPAAGEALVAWAGGVTRALAPGFAPAPLGAIALRDAEDRPLQGARPIAAFLSDSDFSTAIFFRAPGDPSELPQNRMLLDTAFVQNARQLDPVSGQELRVGSQPRPDGARGRAVRIGGAPWPRAILYQRPAGSAGFELPPEEIETTRTRELTAEEIIARHQEVQKRQDDRLERWIAGGRIDYHYKLAQGGATVDVSIEANYFWERGGELEWEQTAYYINGNRVRWKKFPELPLIQPERVVTLPLDLTLDKTYTYRKVGRERVDGREAYVLEFLPVDPDAPRSLYRGRVWIDAERFSRLKATLLQTRLESPVLSNEEVDVYGPHGDPQDPLWLLTRIDGQQLWSTAGRSLIVRREVSFREYEVNPPVDEFERRREAAYASTNTMLRETSQGYRYLERQEDGSRTVKDGVDSSQLFAAVGAFEDASSDGVTPLAGVNYFNYDLGGRNIQINALFGGVVASFNASKPDLFGGNVSGSVDAFGAAMFFDDEVFSGDQELEEETIKTRGQNISFRLGVPAGQFFRFNLIGGLAFRQFDESDDGEDAIAAYNTANPGQQLAFLPPEDHLELRGGVELEYNRRGYTIVAGGAWHDRSDWESWGLFDSTGGTFVTFDPGSGLYVPGQPEPLEESFTRYSLVGFKEWFLPAFQKIRAEIDYLDGSGFDRFSAYQFSLFGDDRLNGFAGSGVRFDSGFIGRVRYSFNLFEAIRFDATLENARVDERGSLEDDLSFTGAGIAATVVGPWKTVINASYGRALSSDIPDLEGEDEFLLLILKLF